MKLNLGCGGNILEGWENHDADVDITKPLPYADNSVDAIFCEHCVEHVTHIQALDFLQECLRVLKPGGQVRICIPVLDRLPREHAVDIIRNHGHQAAYSTELIGMILIAAGFEKVLRAGRSSIDGHWKVIGRDKDDLETARWEAVK